MKHDASFWVHTRLAAQRNKIWSLKSVRSKLHTSYRKKHWGEFCCWWHIFIDRFVCLSLRPFPYQPNNGCELPWTKALQQSMLGAIAPIQMNRCLRQGTGEGCSHKACFLRAVKPVLILSIGEWDAVWHHWWLVPRTQHIRGQTVGMHWTYFYWAPMYTRHWSRCWWCSRIQSRQKSLPFQSSWSLHSSETKITCGENDLVMSQKTIPLNRNKWDCLLFKS